MNNSMTVYNPVFDKDDTKAIKGIAIVLMLFHHLACFPDRVPVGFSGFASIWGGFITGGFLQAFALSAKICVSFYFFLGGYGLFMRWRSSKFSVTTTILNLYKAYWRVFFVFVPIAILFFARSGSEINELCTKYVFDRKFDMITELLSNLIGWSSSLNPEWWFLKSYICVIPLGYLFCIGTKRNQNIWVDFFLVLVVDILIRSLLPSVVNSNVLSSLNYNLYYVSFFTLDQYAGTFFAGIVFAKYDAICVIKRRIRDLSHTMVLGVLAFVVLIGCRTFVIGAEADIIYCALMIPMLSVILDKCDVLKRCFCFLGEHSTNMWLIHSFYCYYFLEVTYIVFCSRNVWVDLLVLITLSLASSIALNGFYRTIGRWIGRTRTLSEIQR